MYSNADDLKQGDAELGVRGACEVVEENKGIGVEGDEDEEYLLSAEDNIRAYIYIIIAISLAVDANITIVNPVEPTHG